MSDDVALPLEFTDAAAKKVKVLIADEENPNLKLRVYITGGGCSGFQYGFTIFAPMLALGTLLGTAFGVAAMHLFPAYNLDAGTFAIAGMGALLAASVRAPLTGIVLVLEMTDNYQLILPMIITGLGATLLAQFLGGQPLYATILARTLAKQEAEQEAKARQSAPENT